ncbi:MAG: hypothetical protein J7621_18455 [Niastella sp.]|nr:hypothetical protein [Niastella sp.]
MPSRKKKAAPKKKAIAKKKPVAKKKPAAGKKVSAPPQGTPFKKTTAPGRTKLPPLDKASNKEITVQVIEIVTGAGREKSLDMMLIRTERFRTNDHVFDIHTHQDEKKPRLIIDAYKVTPEGKQQPNILRKIIKADPSAKTLRSHAGYAEAIAALKKELENIPVS